MSQLWNNSRGWLLPSRQVNRKRLEELAKPTKYYEPVDPEKPYRVKRSALVYRINSYINELAIPCERQHREEKYKVGVPRRALRAKITPRVEQLAEPKHKYDWHYRDDPFRVPHRALVAKSNFRINRLAKPKKPYQPEPKKFKFSAPYLVVDGKV